MGVCLLRKSGTRNGDFFVRWSFDGGDEKRDEKGV